MDLGLGNLIELKRQLLPSANQSGTVYDSKLQALGSGVAKAFEKYCNRLFARVVGDTYEFSAERDHIIVPRYPLESISQVEYRASMDTGYVVQDASIILNRMDKAGIVWFAGAMGFWTETAKLTYTGGYWYDTSESENTVQPVGSTKVPEDLRLAWYLQCRKVWESIDKSGANITKVGSGAQFVTESLGGLEMVPSVKQVLDGYRRFAMT